MYRIAQSDAFSPSVRGLFIFCLAGGIGGSQLWSFKVARRLFTKCAIDQTLSPSVLASDAALVSREQRCTMLHKGYRKGETQAARSRVRE